MEETKVESVENGDKPADTPTEAPVAPSEPASETVEDKSKDETPNGPKIESDDAEMTPREKELLDTVFQLESDKMQLIEETKAKVLQIRKELEDCRLENDKLKKKNVIMEQNLIQKEAQSAEPKTRKEQADVLLKAKTLLFEKTKVCKHQEQQIESLKLHVASIKEVLAVTKEMLNLRNTEVEHLEDRMNNIDVVMKAEKERSKLVEKKLQISQEAYQKIRKEYDIQSNIYKELKVNYLMKIQLLTDELQKYKGENNSVPEVNHTK